MKPISTLSLLLSVSLVLQTQAEDWPQFRGTDRTDISKETGLLKKWPDKGPKLDWLYQDAGMGYSGPSIVKGSIYLLAGYGDGTFLVALDEKTGKRKWDLKIGEILDNRWGDGPRATPTVADGHVYALGGRGNLVCADGQTGKEIWRKSLTEDLGGKAPNWGYCESVLVDGKMVICTPGEDQGAIAALDAMTGKVIWQAKEVTDGAQYASVVPAMIHGERQYIQLFQKTLVGVSAKDGKLLWSVDWSGRTAVIPTPIVKDNVVYVCAGYGVGSMAVEIGKDNSVKELYRNKIMKNHHGGVILVEDHLYGYSDARGWLCQNLKTGEEVWSNEKDLGKGAIGCADGMLYCVDENDGTVVLIEASPKEWKESGRFKLDPQTKFRSPSGKIWTHPVIANGKLYLRDQDLFFCFDVKGS
ncbi:MAG: outer membrane protein assembly factor BamB [Verrucomicrobiales bacterium]|jgi:outer membrane protein assembly factor BamB